MVDPVYHKTEAGQEEIRTRARKLEHKLRALLLIVNGERRKAELLAQVGGMGVGQESFDTLLSLGLIAPDEDGAPAAPVETSLFALAAGRGNPSGDTANGARMSAPQAGNDGYQQLYHFYTDVIGHHLGLRGYVLQVKVEKAATLVELAALREPLGLALQKARGDITARAIIDQLDGLLGTMGVAPVR